MINIAGLNKNDVVNGEGVSVSVFLQGCHFRCPGCHNPEAWPEDGGQPYMEQEFINIVLEAIGANGIMRNLSILGGEPLDTDDKIEFVKQLIYQTKNKYPNIKIVLWTGYEYEEIKDRVDLKYIFNNIDYLIDGPFKIEERDITLKWRGSRNQKIRNLKTGETEC